MTKLDQMIDEALRDQDRAILDATKEQGWFALGQFRGKLAWAVWVIMVVQIMLFGVGAWCAVQFFAASDVLAALKWGISGAVLILLATQLKLSLMPQIQADRMMRELKRVELIIMRNQD